MTNVKLIPCFFGVIFDLRQQLVLHHGIMEFQFLLQLLVQLVSQFPFLYASLLYLQVDLDIDIQVQLEILLL